MACIVRSIALILELFKKHKMKSSKFSGVARLILALAFVAGSLGLNLVHPEGTKKQDKVATLDLFSSVALAETEIPGVHWQLGCNCPWYQNSGCKCVFY